jgi:hypothetical protein
VTFLDRLLRNLLIVFVVLIVLVPAGLLASGTAYGEWSADKLQGLVGFVPAGVASLSGLWHAPLSDYGLPALSDTFLGQSLGYYASAIIGAVLCGGVFILIGRALTRNAPKNEE